MTPRAEQGAARIPAAGGGLARMLTPRSVAVIGASADPRRIGGRPIAYMLRQHFAGTILPVNPGRAEVQGLPCFASVADLPEVPDAAIVAVPAVHALEQIEALGTRGCAVAIVFSAGFAEADDRPDGEGHWAQRQMAEIGRRHGMRVLGPNCLGLFNARIGFFPTFSSAFENGFPIPGRIGIASQSGAYGTHLFATARDRRIGTPICITTGNEADVTMGEIIGLLAEDPETDVIAAYAEGLRDADSLIAALTAARRNRKPVIMMKVGRSALGAAAAQSHTASVAGDDRVTEAVLREFGVVRATSSEQLLDIASLATKKIYPVGNTLGVITVSGGAGVMISDEAERIGLAMPAMPEATQARLKQALSFAAPRNPVDVTAQAFNDMSLIGRFADAMVAEGGYKSVLCFFSQSGGAASIGPQIRAQLNDVRAAHPDRLYVMSVIAPEATLREYEQEGYVVFGEALRGVTAIKAMGEIGESFSRAAVATPPEGAPLALPGRTPSEAEAKRILAAAGLPIAPEREATTAEAAAAAATALGFPVVMKILSPDILHKSEIGGVLLGVGDADAARQGFDTLMERARAHAPGARLEGVLVARQLSGGVECLMGIQRDPVFGPIAVFGLGGIFVEILDDVVLRRCPFDTATAEAMIRSIRGIRLLIGARGRPHADIPALAHMLSTLSIAAAASDASLASIDLNPVFAMPEGEGAWIADALIEISPPDAGAASHPVAEAADG